MAQHSTTKSPRNQLLMALGALVLIWLGFRFAYAYLDRMIEYQPARLQLDEQISPLVLPKSAADLEAAIPAQKHLTSSPAPMRVAKPVEQLELVASERIVLRTIGGDIVLALYPKAAPKTVEQLLKLVRAGVLDTSHFGRLEKNFVLQTSVAQDRLSPLTPEQAKLIHPLNGEFSKTLKHRRGVLSMGRQDGQPDSAETSFSILLNTAPHLDGQYTIFGHVESGMETVDRLLQVGCEPDSNRPAYRLTILQAQVVHQDVLSTMELEKPRDLHQIEQQIYPAPTIAARSLSILEQHCWRCHNESSAKGMLVLSTQNGFKQGGEHGSLLDKKEVTSSLLHKRLVASDDSRMPPPGNKLHDEDIKTLTLWMRHGAAFPAGYESWKVAASRKPHAPSTIAHWAWQPIKPINVPLVTDSSWCNNEIDRFILAKLEARKLTPAPRATVSQLHRRVHYTLSGLPPHYDSAQNSTLSDSISTLLQSERYGEHMARQWLDLVRYADSDGYEDDRNRPLAYTYRDFLIRAFNQDLAFDQFLQWQIAGDELAPEVPDALAATGFLAAGPYQTFFAKKKDRLDELDDIVSTAGVAFMGITIGCARCHDHKHDPLTQHDYYRLVSVFNGSRRLERYLNTAAGLHYDNIHEPVDALMFQLQQLSEPARTEARNKKIQALPIKPEEMEQLRLPFDDKNPVQVSLLRRFEHLITVSDNEVKSARKEEVAEKWDELQSQIENEEARLPKAPQKGLIYTGSRTEPARFLERGDPHRERELVPPGFITILTRGQPAWHAATWKAWSEMPRSAFARWLTDEEAGPAHLVARVIVNRIWQLHFGQGLVRTANDFGLHGDSPTHPELLDWLARDFIQHGWKLKRLHRMILESNTWQLSSTASPALLQHDPANQLMARQSTNRLSAESLRDSVLKACGNLNETMYGPGIKPPIPREAIFQTALKHGVVWPEDASESPENWRRSIYIYAKRSNPVPMLQLFDMPDSSASCSRRSQSTVPTQSLAMLNDPFIRNQAGILADRLMNESKGKVKECIQAAYRRILGRQCTSQELESCHSWLYQSNSISKSFDLARLTDLCHVLLMSNEFLYVN